VNDWKALKERFSLSDEDTDAYLDILNWVTNEWVQKNFGYPKDSPQSFSLEKRFDDDGFRKRFETAIDDLLKER